MDTFSWTLDELAHAGPEHLEADYVSLYDEKAFTNPTIDLAVLRDLGLDATHSVVDLGAGTGTFALAVARLCRRVIAVDVSPVMLSQLRETAARRGIKNIEYVQQGFLTYAHQGPPVDFVYSRHALHHLPDFWKVIALQRIAAILRPGGIFYLRDLIFSCEPSEVTQVVDAWLARASTDPNQGWTRAELETHLREEYSTFSWLLEPMLERAGFDIRDADHDESRVYAAYVCIKR